MGLFKSAFEIQRQAKEISKNWDPAAQMAEAQARMAATNEMLAKQTAASRLAVSGTDAAASVVAASETGTFLNMQPVLDIDLTVMPPGQPPFAVRVRQPVGITHVAALRPGAPLRVKFDPADRTTVWIDPASLSSA
jgi:hypothetical protein